VEEVVLQTGLVGETVAIGFPDEELGQTIIVVVTPAQGEGVDVDALAEECRKNLPLYMVPRQILVMESLPRNPNGKIDRTGLRDELLTSGRLDD
jgi:acyl-CoA synthetase (AMP-forming)/AMP-acid ligase II